MLSSSCLVFSLDEHALASGCLDVYTFCRYISQEEMPDEVVRVSPWVHMVHGVLLQLHNTTRQTVATPFKLLHSSSGLPASTARLLTQVPWAHKYLAGWGYLLSADVVLHIVGKYLRWKQHPEEAPGWYPGVLCHHQLALGFGSQAIR